MKKKFMRGIAAFLAVVMMLPTSALADTPTQPDNTNPDSGIMVASDPAITISTTDLYDGESEKKTAQLTLTGVPEGTTVQWSVPFDGDKLAVNSSTGVVTAKAKGTATVSARYSYVDGENTVTDTIDFTVTVKEYKMTGIEIDSSKTKTDYVAGQKISASDIHVNASYSDGTSKRITNFTFTPDASTVLTADHNEIEVKAGGFEDSVGISVNDINVDELVDSVSLSYPKSTTEFKVGDKLKLSDIELAVTYLGGSSGIVTPAQNSKIEVSGITFSNGSYTFSSDDAKNPPTLKVKYVGEEFSVTLKVVEKTPEKTITGIDARPSKTEYTKGNTITKSTDVKVYIKYSDGSEEELASNKYTLSPSTLSKTGTVTVTVTAQSNTGSQYSDTYTVTVKDVINVTGLDKDDDEYKLWDDDEIELKVGDKLNDDVMWYDIFDEVHLIVDGKNKLIDSKNDLNDYPGVQLLLRVYSDGSDTIKASHVGSDGKVRLQLYVKNGTTSITSTSYSIREYVPVTEAECTVSIYSSKTSTSSSYLKATKSFDDFADALAAIESEDDLEDEFDVTLGTNYVIRIKFGKDQELSSSYEFEPDYYYENPIFIDLNGNDLKLPSDWIVYDDCEDLVVTITNSNSKEDGKLIYRDKSVTLTVANGSTLEFSEDNIPMDSDAAVTVNIYKSTSTTSSALIKTKVYDKLKDLLDDLEKQEEALETFDIDDDYEDEFVARIKLGEDEDQDISGYTFAPDYDATIFIDLNGNKLTLDTDWIDYDSDNDELSVKVNNTNTDNATLVYDDENITVTVKKGASALEFKEDEIPGIYEISLGSMTNGKATMSKDTVGHGGSVKFTITPNSGYAIDTVKINSKTVSTSSYTVDSKGVGTYELKDITADSKLDVTFKKASSTTTEKEEDKTTTSTTNWTNPFTDVSKNAQYYDAVAFVCSEGLFNGMTATKFEPTTTMTRAMFVTVLGRLAGVDANRYSGTSFTDVSKTDQQISWAAPYIEWAVQNGITQGTGNGKFSPNDPITHQQMYLFMYRYAMFVENITTNITNVSLSGIKDASQIADWAQDGVKFASRNNILITSGGKLTPADNALRCELAMLLQGFCTKVLGYNG